MSNEIEDFRKRLQATEKAIVELHSKDLGILKIMAVESCTTQYNMFAFLQRGEELDKYKDPLVKEIKRYTARDW